MALCADRAARGIVITLLHSADKSPEGIGFRSKIPIAFLRRPAPFPEVEMAARLTAFVVVAIVAATLIAGLIVGAQRDDSDGPVDLIVHNAQVYTADTPDERPKPSPSAATRFCASAASARSPASSVRRRR